MIWVIGSKGNIGKEVCEKLKENNFHWIGTDSEVDITNPDSLEKFSKGIETAAYFPSELPRSERLIKWIINCTSINNYEEAKNNPEKAEAINSKGCENIARLSRKIGAKLIHISDASVFAGKPGKALIETDEKSPLSVLGKTQLNGEISIQKEMNQYYILRTNCLYGKYDCSVTNDVKKFLNEDEITLPDSGNFTPTSLEDLINVIIHIIDKSNNATELFGKHSAPSFGVYNFSNSGSANNNDLFEEIKHLCKKYYKIDREYRLIFDETSEDYPRNIVLNCEKLTKELNIKLPNWEKSLEKFIKNNKTYFIN